MLHDMALDFEFQSTPPQRWRQQKYTNSFLIFTLLPVFCTHKYQYLFLAAFIQTSGTNICAIFLVRIPREFHDHLGFAPNRKLASQAFYSHKRNPGNQEIRKICSLHFIISSVVLNGNMQSASITITAYYSKEYVFHNHTCSSKSACLSKRLTTAKTANVQNPQKINVSSIFTPLSTPTCSTFVLCLFPRW